MTIKCDACEKAATHSFKIRYSNEKSDRHKVCEKHYNIATSDLIKFKKHLRKNKARLK